ncbi:MAG: hypothetical protein WDW38_001012 [Sanguina aurantia]
MTPRQDPRDENRSGSTSSPGYRRPDLFGAGSSRGSRAVLALVAALTAAAAATSSLMRAALPSRPRSPARQPPPTHTPLSLVPPLPSESRSSPPAGPASHPLSDLRTDTGSESAHPPDDSASSPGAPLHTALLPQTPLEPSAPFPAITHPDLDRSPDRADLHRSATYSAAQLTAGARGHPGGPVYQGNICVAAAVPQLLRRLRAETANRRLSSGDLAALLSGGRTSGLRLMLGPRVGPPGMGGSRATSEMQQLVLVGGGGDDLEADGVVLAGEGRGGPLPAAVHTMMA